MCGGVETIDGCRMGVHCAPKGKQINRVLINNINLLLSSSSSSYRYRCVGIPGGIMIISRWYRLNDCGKEKLHDRNNIMIDGANE